ncbi:hypothetical protein RGE_09790 [Rubrivivax gelatinosus IL144]|uniref:Uncharacterized protein n=1 Tax=Rubrivivax gelatinosus (strain NBRC 100245 / IL144) TaxID=983917 RepID=I0HMT3_RUBGI|nr:hypothetical protein RGE_09790 [Rubrivivax gelatinosus IL144]
MRRAASKSGGVRTRDNGRQGEGNVLWMPANGTTLPCGALGAPLRGRDLGECLATRERGRVSRAHVRIPAQRQA